LSAGRVGTWIKGVVSDISTACILLLPRKYAAAFELMPVKVGTQAAGSVGAFEKLDNVPQATLPFASVTGAAT